MGQYRRLPLMEREELSLMLAPGHSLERRCAQCGAAHVRWLGTGRKRPAMIRQRSRTITFLVDVRLLLMGTG